jgi:hypothetical protein
MPCDPHIDAISDSFSQDRKNLNDERQMGIRDGKWKRGEKKQSFDQKCIRVLL